MLPTLKSGSFYLKDTHLTDILPEYTLIDDEPPSYFKSFNLANPKSAEFELEAEINIPELYRLHDIDYDILSRCRNLGLSFSVEYSEPYQEQRRKHKKKRINKKWAKKYGYVTKFRKWRINEITMTSKNDFEFEATGKNIELVKG